MNSRSLSGYTPVPSLNKHVLNSELNRVPNRRPKGETEDHQTSRLSAQVTSQSNRQHQVKNKFSISEVPAIPKAMKHKPVIPQNNIAEHLQKERSTNERGNEAKIGLLFV